MNIGGAGSYVYDTPVNDDTAPVAMETKPKAEEKKTTRGPVKGETIMWRLNITQPTVFV